MSSPPVCLAVILTALSLVAGRCNAQQAAAVAEERFVIPDDAALPGEGPMRRYDWFQNVWRNRRTTFQANRDAKQGAVVFLGDSITQGWGDDFRGALPSVSKANRGISGDTTRGMLSRLDQDVLQLDPAAVVLLMGTNDLEEGAEPETIAGNVQRIVQALKQHDPKMPIVLCEVFPSSSEKARPADKIKQINQLYRDLAKGDPQITVLDTWTLFADDSGNAKAAEFPDLLHPNAKGYAKWEAALRPILATLGFADTEPDDFEYEPDAIRLFNGEDLTGWEYRRTPDAMRAARQRWLARSPGAVHWPLVDQKQSFDGMRATPDGRYVAINGRLVVTTPPQGRSIQQLWTADDFDQDFQLLLEFRATPNADSGVFIRGQQLQCRDYLLAGPYKDLKHYRPGDWNQLEITVRGTNAHSTCNGEVLETSMEVPAEGPIGLEGDRGQVEYRRIRLRPLD
ncbi:DUF1080 domain-containing protein [Roseiconus nitratireducens]|uniref:DUF1080 domain-containing protein n=1 Tax=Roseiconus nitratireducens TaxID=2605748 RepID=A0A5M6D365_9BACT|nr:GDSL-type esterase/lipase family protein [Roseiconus nitratireducens]KAA5539615.1 DUF1080 domain-containing protein [Roseiconus nitratireducens]